MYIINSHPLCGALNIERAAQQVKSKRESRENMLILTFSYFWVLVSIFGPVLGAKCPSRAAVNRDTNTMQARKPSRAYEIG